MWLPECIVLGPGGIKGYAELGYIMFLEENNLLSKVQQFIGCSVGSLISLLLICGYTSSEIIESSLDFRFLNENFSLKEIKDEKGLLSHNEFEDKIKKMVLSKLDLEDVPSMEQLHEITGKELIIVATKCSKILINIDDGNNDVNNIAYSSESVVLNRENFPELSCIKACLMSCNIPLIFREIKFNDNYFLDGALTNPYPVDLVDKELKTLGIYIQSTYVDNDLESDNSIFVYVNIVIDSPLDLLRRQNMEKCGENCRHVCIYCPFTTSSLPLKSVNKGKMIAADYNTGKKTCEIFEI